MEIWPGYYNIVWDSIVSGSRTGLGLVRETDSQHSNSKQVEKNCYISTAVNTFYAKATKPHYYALIHLGCLNLFTTSCFTAGSPFILTSTISRLFCTQRAGQTVSKATETTGKQHTH